MGKRGNERVPIYGKGYHLIITVTPPHLPKQTKQRHNLNSNLRCRSSSRRFSLRSRRTTLLQLLLDRPLQPLRLGSTSPPPLNQPIPPNQKLLKIPLDSLQSHDPRFGRFHPLPDGLRGSAIDVGFAEDGEGDAVV